MYRFISFVVLLVMWFDGFGQHQESGEGDKPVFQELAVEHDSLHRILHDFGTFEGHFRTSYMHTVNYRNNPDYFALAMGGGLAYYSPVIKNFQLGLSGFIIHNLASSDLAAKNGFINRYESGLFDISNPENRGDLDRLENLYLRYYIDQGQRSFIQLGKFHVRTPLVNLQDGRMRPNVQEGLWFELKHWNKLQFAGGWISRMSPRSTVEWYGIGESVGLYPSGRAVNGAPSEYAGHVDSDRLIIGSVGWKPVNQINYQVWNYYADNLFNVLLHKVELRKPVNDRVWTAGMQYLWQRSLSDGKIAVENQYIAPDEQSHVFSGRIGFTDTIRQHGWSLNYTRITSHGRFLFPREWGVETFYTFMQRERNEGAGDVQGVMLEHSRMLDKARRLSVRTRGGIYSMPAVSNAALNKYAMPSYYQLGLEGNYRFKGFLNGLEAQMLYTYKGSLDGDFEERPVILHNKANMHHFTLRMDYYF